MFYFFVLLVTFGHKLLYLKTKIVIIQIVVCCKIGGTNMTEKITMMNEEKTKEVLFHSPKLDKKKSGELTGYASIDKPWLQYYKEEAHDCVIPEQTLYQALVENNKDNLENAIFVCADRNNQKVSYGEFIEMVDNFAKALVALGLKPGDEIITTFKNSIEGIALVFAKSRLGVVAHFIDPTNSPAEKKRMISETNAKHYFIAEEFLPSAEPLVKGNIIDNIVVLPTLNSNKVETDLTTLEQSESYTSYQDFIKNGENETLPEVHPFDKYEVSTIMYTGGSTGPSKGVKLTDYNFVSKYYRQMNSNWKWGRNRINLSCLPGIIAFGLSESIVSPILAGETNVVVDCLQIPKFSEFVLTNKPNDVSCSPIHIEFLVNSPLIDENTDLSFLEMMPCGGDGMTKQADEYARKFLEAHGAKDAFAQGCGFTESTGAFCYGLGEENEPGYMGIPLAGNVSAVFDPATGEELKYGEVGEWAVMTDTAMVGYLDEEKTKKALKTHADGQVWLHPGDMVHMNEQGKIAMHDRTSRTFNFMGLKVYPSALESFLSKHPAVQKCILSGIKSPFTAAIAVTDQKIPIVNVAIKDEYKGKEEQVMAELEQIIAENAQSYINIFAYIFRDELPYTNRGKINYQQLETEGFEEKADRKVFVKKPSMPN